MTSLGNTLRAGCCVLLLFASQRLIAGQPPLEVWIGGDKGYAGLTAIAQRYQTSVKGEVTVRHFENLPRLFELAAARGEGPDVLLWAHDRFGEWAERGWLLPVTPSEEFRKGVAPFVWPALTYKGQIYGYPIAVEAVSLLYNRKLLPHPPQSLAQLIDMSAELRSRGIAPIGWNYTNTYFSWGMLAALGGYSFKQLSTGFDANDVGVNAAGMVKGARLLQQLINDQVVASDLTGQRALDAFAKGDVAMTIDGPWVWSDLTDGGIDLGVAPLPRVEGRFSAPFVGVWSAAITRFAEDPERAATFIEDYLLSMEGLTAMDADDPLGAVANRELMGVLAADPRVDQTFLIAVRGQLMPNIPAMGQFWRTMEWAMAQMLVDQQDPQQVLDRAAKAILTAEP